MQPQSTVRVSSRASEPFVAPIVPKDGRITLDGFGIRIAVERGHLAISDGIGEDRRAATLAKATCKLRRLAVIGHTGSISLEALRWLADAGASLTVIDKDGAVILAHGPRGRDDGRLRRAQAIAPYTGAHLGIIRSLLGRKLAGQAATLRRFRPDDALAIRAIEGYADALTNADTAEWVRGLEANAAFTHWEALADTPITFGKRDRVPEHWRTFGGRASALTGNPRKASNPINAMLNYVYAILEAEASIACWAVGLDPALGVLHADLANRDSLACDVMEAIRPDVDSFVLDLLATRNFSAAAFHETREGVCRVLPPLTHTLTETGHVWAKLLAPIVEEVAQALSDTALPAFGTLGAPHRPARGRAPMPKPASLPTPLTQRKRSEGREAQRRHGRRGPAPAPMFPSTCRSCGLPLPEADRLYCEECRPERQAEVLATFTERGPKTLAGTNHGGECGAKRGRANANRQKAIQEWEREHGTDHDPHIFTEHILPTIREVSLSRLVAATGLSLRYCSLVRQGKYVPHPMHWEAFSQAAGIHR